MGDASVGQEEGPRSPCWLQTPNPSNSNWAVQLVTRGTGASTAARFTLLAAALLLVCQGGGGRGVDADPPAAAWHKATQGP